LCENSSFSIICKDCREFLKPAVKLRGNVVSFYPYEEISELIKYKYSKFGSRVFNLLSNYSFKPFGKYLSGKLDEKIYAIGIDDRVKRGYSHTAILVKNLKSKNIKPLFSVLHATNDVSYAGKTLSFRLENPRNFIYTGKKGIKAVLVDDVLTTGTTLNEAEEVLKKNGVEVVYKIVLSDLKAKSL